MKNISVMARGFVVNGAILLGLGGGLALLDIALVWGLFTPTSFFIYIIALTTLQFFINMGLAIFLFVKQHHEGAYACLVSGVVVPFVGVLLARLAVGL